MSSFKINKPPNAFDPSKVGTYPAKTYSGGGYFYDEVLEYRVWTKENGEAVYHAFATYDDALQFSKNTKNAEKPLVLVQQNSYIAETDDGRVSHVHKQRVAEWQVEWLDGNRGTLEKIPVFIANAKSSR